MSGFPAARVFEPGWEEGLYLALDVETTGLDHRHCRVVELGALLFRPSRPLEEARRLESLVNPGIPIPSFVSSIHGITDGDVAGAPGFGELAGALLELAAGATVIAHNVKFDLGFIGMELGRLGLPLLANPSLDTLPLARKAWPGLPSYSLPRLVAALGIQGGRGHRALDDARSCAALFVAAGRALEAKVAPKPTRRLRKTAPLPTAGNPPLPTPAAGGYHPPMSSSRTNYDLVVLAGDIGGTNANLALIGKKGGTFTLIFDRHYKTREEASMTSALERFLAEAGGAAPAWKPELCCISGAGPVRNGGIVMTNAPWSIDGHEIEGAFSLPTLVINDFTAVSYGVLLLDSRNPDQIRRLAHTDGSDPEPRPGPRLVIGAGTGLGLGYVVKVHDRTEAFPSEGGHVTLPVYDATTRDFQAWLEARLGFVPGAEAAVSGMGIANIHEFLAPRRGGGAVSAEILALPEGERPARISAAAGTDPICTETMEIFVKLYARVAADAAAVFLPAGGIFLAGGIAAKNEARFIEGDRFMAMFERNYREHIRTILASTPVMIVKDYAISLYGAANAAALNC